MQCWFDYQEQFRLESKCGPLLTRDSQETSLQSIKIGTPRIMQHPVTCSVLRRSQTTASKILASHYSLKLDH